MTSTTPSRPAYRAPWTNGAYAYPEADTFTAAQAALIRRRKVVMIHMTNTGEAGTHTCAVCGNALNQTPNLDVIGGTSNKTEPDHWSTWDYVPRIKRVVNGRHYICSWSALLTDIAKIHTP